MRVAIPGRGVLLADLEDDGMVEIFCAGVSAAGNTTLAVLDHHGHLVWQYELSEVQPLWPDAGLDQWSVGKLNEDEVLDM